MSVDELPSLPLRVNSRDSRRQFFKTCLATATMVAANPGMIASAAPVKSYQRSLLTDANGRPLTSSALQNDQAFIFHYPFVTTPCFLINIGRPLVPGLDLEAAESGSYHWQGGSGPQQSVVAFSAICAHKLSYPTRTLSFLNYRPGSTTFLSSNNVMDQRQQLIYCCSERSAYDPSRGAEVIGGPARQPLTAVELEYDPSNDQYYATGTRGGELYEEFFGKFGFRLALDHGVSDIRQPAAETTVAWLHSDYSERAVSCS